MYIEKLIKIMFEFCYLRNFMTFQATSISVVYGERGTIRAKVNN